MSDESQHYGNHYISCMSFFCGEGCHASGSLILYTAKQAVMTSVDLETDYVAYSAYSII